VLFNWLVARKAGGTFVLRIEDTDQTRHIEDSVQKILDDLRWLGFEWDEGPEVGGDYGPYFQSQRIDLYDKYLRQLLESGGAYYALETSEELAAMREAAEKTSGGFRYPRPDPLPTIEQGEAARAAGSPTVVRFKMPDEPITVVDDILGNVTLEADQFDDFVIQKSDGFPTYHFACVVDDELMKITDVLRGQEHLMNTPKHVAIQRALGFATPRYGHMPVIFNMSGTKMSKRDKEKAIKKGETPPEIDVHDFRVAGYLPEAVANFIALLGWNPGDEREKFTLTELIETFSVERIGKTSAKFDRDKLLSFNTDWASKVSPERLLEAFKDFLEKSMTAVGEDGVAAPPPRGLKPAAREEGVSRGAGKPAADQGAMAKPAESSPGMPKDTDGGRRHAATNATSTTTDARSPLPSPLSEGGLRGVPDSTLAKVLEVCAGFRTFRDVLNKAGFLFVNDEAIEYDAVAVKKVLAKSDGAGYAMLELLLPRFESHDDWSHESLEALVKQVCEERDTKMGSVAQPIRVAVSGSTISPAIGETLALLGKDRTLARITRCLGTARTN